MTPLSAVGLPDGFDAARAFAGGLAAAEFAFWLDAGPEASAGWSWLGAGVPEPDPERVRAVVCTGPPRAAEWGPFSGGWVGWLGYDDAARRAGAPASTADDTVPQTLWLRVDRFVAVDHARGRAWAVAPADEVAGFAATVQEWTDAATPTPAAVAPSATARARHTPEEDAAAVERCRAAIREGDAYQLCLTTRFDVRHPIDPVAAHAALRTATPAHHGGVVRAGECALVSASPEQFLTVADGVARTRPIKGTRPRATDPREDAALAAELLASPKERAENLMIVDLMRNDISRVSEPGTIAVEQLFAVESYPAVHQLVSTVAGRLRAGTTVGDLLDAAFPAGSMTGAPKLSAMTLLQSEERAPRGVFAGCFGWVGDDGALDLAMVIRSIVTSADGAYVGAGGGITWGSHAPAEVAEVGVKARGPLAAIGAELPPGW
jgi:para-aminobenzoate synthetase component I